MEGTIGEIRMFGGNFAPRAWAICSGQLLPIAQNTALFSILGTIYGGDGRTTFGLPDLRGRAAMHEGRGPGMTDRRLGAKFGTEENIMTTTTMPNHNHLAQVSVSGGLQVGGRGSADDPVNNYLGSSTGVYRSAGGNSVLGGAEGLSGDVTIGNTGNQIPFNNMMPYTTVNFVICLQGTFPSRS